MKAIVYSQEERLQALIRNMKTSQMRLMNLKTIGLSLLVAVKMTSMSLSNATCKMKKPRVAVKIGPKRKRTLCLPKLKSFLASHRFPLGKKKRR